MTATWDTINDLIAQGSITRVDDLSCGDPQAYERNLARAIAAGKPACVHCGRAVNLRTAWVFRQVQPSPLPVAAAVDVEFDPALGLDTIWRLVGSTCGPEFLGERYRRRASTVAADSIHDARP